VVIGTATRYRRGSVGTGPPASFSAASQGAQRRVLDDSLVIAGERPLNQAEKVLEYFWVALDAVLPVFINGLLQGSLGSCNLVGVRWGVVVVVC